MNGLSNAHHLRKTVAGICMVGAPLLLLLSMIVESRIGTSEDSFVIGRVGDPDTGSLEQMLLVVGLVLMVPAVLGLIHMLRERESPTGHLGGAVALIGLLVMPFAWMAGMILLAAALYRARTVQPAMALSMAAGAALLTAGGGFESEVLALAGAAVMLVGLGGTGWMVLKETDEEWAGGGYRPAATT